MAIAWQNLHNIAMASDEHMKNISRATCLDVSVTMGTAPKLLLSRLAYGWQGHLRTPIIGLGYDSAKLNEAVEETGRLACGMLLAHLQAHPKKLMFSSV